MIRLLLISSFLLITFSQTRAQNSFVEAKVIERDTIIIADTLEIIFVVHHTGIFRKYKEWRYNRTVRNFKKVYPYAKKASVILTQINKDYLLLKTDREKKKFIKAAEKKLFKEFEGDLRNMTISQGRMLIKLIDRETGNTTFEIVKEFKGGFSAFFWQSIAVVFGSSLKYEYDKDGKDEEIERLVRLYELGLL